MLGVEVSSIVGVLPPVLQIDLLSAFEQEIELILIKDLQNIGWDHAVETLQEGFQLVFYLSHQVVFGCT